MSYPQSYCCVENWGAEQQVAQTDAENPSFRVRIPLIGRIQGRLRMSPGRPPVKRQFNLFFTLRVNIVWEYFKLL